jgi:transcriptional regulator with XRE-family HTH domain
MRKALRDADIGVHDMADYLGVARNTVSTWINGRHPASMQTMRLWAMRCGVPYEWLRSGDDTSPPDEWAVGDSNPEPTGYGHYGLRLARPRSDGFSQRRAA